MARATMGKIESEILFGVLAIFLSSCLCVALARTHLKREDARHAQFLLEGDSGPLAGYFFKG